MKPFTTFPIKFSTWRKSSIHNNLQQSTNRLPPLSPRLLAVAQALSDGKTRSLADIGSDHAYLPIYLIKSGKIDYAVAADIRPGPLSAGEAAAKKYGLHIAQPNQPNQPSQPNQPNQPNQPAQIEFVLSDGFSALGGRRFDAAAICGMGGQSLMKIIENAAETDITTLVLQPMTAHEQVRKYLFSNRYNVKELFCAEGNRPYVILICTKGPPEQEAEPYSYTDLYLGKQHTRSTPTNSTPTNNADYLLYVKKQLLSAQKRLKGKINLNETIKLIEEAKNILKEGL